MGGKTHNCLQTACRYNPSGVISSNQCQSYDCHERGPAYLFFKMIIPMIMLAISDPCNETGRRVKHGHQTEEEVMGGGYMVTGKADKQQSLLI